MAEFASKGVAGTALGFGIGGTALALLGGNGGCGGGLLGGLLGGNRNCAPCEPMETREASCLRQQVAALQAEKYADGVGISTFKAALELSNKNDDAIKSNQKEAFVAIAALDKEVGVLKANINCLAATNEQEHKALSESFKSGLALESERRACGDERIVAWTEGNFIRGTLVLPSTPTVTGFNNGCCCQRGPVAPEASPTSSK